MSKGGERTLTWRRALGRSKRKNTLTDAHRAAISAARKARVRSGGPPKGRPQHGYETISRARALWLAGKTATEIAAEMGMTKGQIVGIAHRNRFSVVQGARP